MSSSLSDAGSTEDSLRGLSAPPDLALALARIAAVLGVRSVVTIGSERLVLDTDLALTHASSSGSDGVDVSRDGLVLLAGDASWNGLEAARVVVAFDHGTHGSALDALAERELAATDAGWQVAHAGLLLAAATGGDSTRHECPLVIACKPHDDEILRLLDNGPLSLALDPVATAVTAGGRPARVLIASYEITGPTGNGGIGTAYHSLAHTLAAAGHDVTLLFTGWLKPEQGAQEQGWREAFAEQGIAFSVLGTPWDLPVRSPHHAVRRAYEFHRWLADAHAAQPFDVVHLPECQGHGAFAQTAKALGLAYEDIEFVVGTHSSTRWVAESNRQSIDNLDLLVTEHLERLSVERADVVMSPSAYLVTYMRHRGWTLPQRTFVQPYALPRSVRDIAPPSNSPTTGGAPRDELVFFGRLETRKGLEAFCDAVDVLVTNGDPSPFTRITLLGRPEAVMGEDATSYVARRAARWGLAWEILPDLGHDEAIAYLRSRPCVVAIPSLVDNAPNTVIEAIGLGVPFVASRSGGTGELIATADLEASTFDGWGASTTLEPPTFADPEVPFDADALASALREKAAAPARRVSRAVEDTACDRVYDTWHRAMAGRDRSPADGTSRRTPSAAVCIVADDASDAERVAAAVRGGTRTPEHVVALCEVAPDPAEIPGVELVQATGRSAGPARNRAIAALDADVLIVLRGNEQPDPSLVERVCAAMAVCDADVLTLVCRDPDATRASDLPEASRRADAPSDLRAFVPVGGPALATAVYPALTVGPYAIRRSALARLDGYTPDAWGEILDHELLARAALAGMRIDVLPDPLATTTRDDRWTELRTGYWGHVPVPVPRGEEQIRMLRPFRRRLDDQLADLPALLAGALRSVGANIERADDEARRRQEIVDAYEARVTEQRELIALYEERQEEMRAALAHASTTSVSAARTGPIRGPVRAWPGRGVRFARWRLELLRRRMR